MNLHRKDVQVSEIEAHIRQIQALNAELNELRRKADAANEAKTKIFEIAVKNSGQPSDSVIYLIYYQMIVLFT